MRTIRPVGAAIGVAAIGVVALVGCSGEAGGGAAGSVGRTDGIGREITEAQAEAALPEKPNGFTSGDYEAGAEDRNTSPEECMDLLLLGSEAEDLRESRSAFAGTTYAKDTGPIDDQEVYTIRIDSHSDPVGPDILATAGSSLGSCSAFSFTGRDDNGNFDERIIAEGLPVKNIGDQTFSVRLTAFPHIDGDVHRQYVDQIHVRVGHTLVSIRSTHYEENADTEDIEDMAQEVLDNLEE